MPIALLIQLASAIPSLMKYVGASDTHTAIAQQAVDIATTVTGIVDPSLAVQKIVQDPAALQAFQLAMTDKQKEWDQMFLSDIQSARNMQIELSKNGGKRYMSTSMYILAIVVIAVLTWEVLKDDSISEYAQGLITLVLGRFLGYLDNIYNFEFGTTRTSQQKDNTISTLSAKSGGS